MIIIVGTIHLNTYCHIISELVPSKGELRWYTNSSIVRFAQVSSIHLILKHIKIANTDMIPLTTFPIFFINSSCFLLSIIIISCHYDTIEYIYQQVSIKSILFFILKGFDARVKALIPSYLKQLLRIYSVFNQLLNTCHHIRFIFFVCHAEPLIM